MTVTNVTPGVVRNLLKTTYYLRIPRQEADNRLLMDRQGQTVALKPNVDTILFWKDFDCVEQELNKLDRDNIVRIIKRPHHVNDDEPTGVQKDGVTVVDYVRFLNFHGAVSVTDEGSLIAGVHIQQQIIEIPFATSDWLDNQLIVIPTGSPGAGEVGPHLLPVNGRQYVVNHFKTISADERRPVDMDTFINFNTGFVAVKKSPVIPDFDGLLVLSVFVS